MAAISDTRTGIVIVSWPTVWRHNINMEASSGLGTRLGLLVVAFTVNKSKNVLCRKVYAFCCFDFKTLAVILRGHSIKKNIQADIRHRVSDLRSNAYHRSMPHCTPLQLWGRIVSMPVLTFAMLDTKCNMGSKPWEKFLCHTLEQLCAWEARCDSPIDGNNKPRYAAR